MKKEIEWDNEQITSRAYNARSLLNDELLQEAFDAAREKFVEGSLNGKTVEAREVARASALGLIEVRKYLEDLIGAGEYAEEVLRRTQ